MAIGGERTKNSPLGRVHGDLNDNLIWEAAERRDTQGYVLIKRIGSKSIFDLSKYM